MPFLSVSYTSFRNIADTTIDLLSKEVYFIGDNGQGKSNILESLYMASYGSSFRTRDDSEIVRTGNSQYGIRAIFRDQKERTNTIHVSWKDGKKRIEKNAKQIIDRKELVDTVPCVLFCHDDLDFAIGTPERKRFFIDQSLSMYDSSYIDMHRQYKKILKSRNCLLKDKKADLLDVLDVQLAQTGLQVIQKRRKTIANFNQVFARLYQEVSGISGVHIEYSPSWKSEDEHSIVQQLIERREQDLLMNTTLTGPHRDRIRYVIGKTPYVPTASTGQRRLLSLILRTAQAQFYTELTGRLPVLLMDDVMLELDPDKRQRFTSVLPEYDQLFCTFLPGEPYERYKRSTTRVFDVSGGEFNVR